MAVATQQAPLQDPKVYDDYEALTKEYKERYGDNTVVAYHQGNFYQVLCADDGLVDIERLAQEIDLILTRQNKSKLHVGRDNCRMIGWPIHENKYFQRILDHNYTLVVTTQFPREPATKQNHKRGAFDRKVTRILSRGTVLPEFEDAAADGDNDAASSSGQRITLGDRASADRNNFIYCVYVKSTTTSDADNHNAYAVAMIDVSTNLSFVCEIYPREDDPAYTVHELVRLRIQFPPLEVVMVSDKKKAAADAAARDTEADARLVEHLVQEMQLKSCMVINKLGKLDPKFHDTRFQNAQLETVFPPEVRRMLSPIAHANLEMLPNASVAFVSLVGYLKDHNEALVERLSPPVPMELNGEDVMILSYNTADQLDLHGGLQTWINKCQTSMGRRYLSYRLLNPTYNAERLEDTYHHTAFFLEQMGIEKIEEQRRSLACIMDLERMLRFMEMNACRMQHMAFLYRSLRALHTILTADPEDHARFARHTRYLDNLAALEDILGWMEATFYLVTADEQNAMVQGERVRFQPGVSNTLDCLHAEVNNIDVLVQDIVRGLNARAADVFKLESNERDGLFLSCTPKRWKDAGNKPGVRDYVHESGKFRFADLAKCSSGNPSQNSVKVSCALFQECLHKRKACLLDIEHNTRQLLGETVKGFLDNYQEPFADIIRATRDIDFHVTSAFIAFKYRFARPSLDAEAERPYVSATQLRHPIVERIQQDINYVGNDIHLGHDMFPRGHQGMLLYGLNAAGKSTLMKSVAISIILAQAGMYVPASSFRFAPFRSLFSRITRGDDINRGQSTFTIEMQELRNILKRSDEYSLIIGDEVCSGTETASAIAIVSAALDDMCRKNRATFIFATHYHDLVHIPLVRALYEETTEPHPLLGIFHLHVEYDPVSHKLVYDRTLKPGQGRTTYGIEVCRALNLESAFIEKANSVRRDYIYRNDNGNRRDTHHVQTSRYNPRFYQPAHTCTVCGKQKINQDYHVHHIRYQNEADAHGYIDTYHKNRMSNLVLLCEDCHDKVHHDEIKIHGWATSSHGGRELIFSKNS